MCSTRRCVSSAFSRGSYSTLDVCKTHLDVLRTQSEVLKAQMRLLKHVLGAGIDALKTHFGILKACPVHVDT